MNIYLVTLLGGGRWCRVLVSALTAEEAGSTAGALTGKVPVSAEERGTGECSAFVVAEGDSPAQKEKNK